MFTSHPLPAEDIKPGAEDYYERLGVPPGINQSELEKRIKEIRIQLHPDGTNGKPHLRSLLLWSQSSILEALSALDNPASRAKYDRSRAKRQVPPPSSAPNEVKVSVAILPNSEGKFSKEHLVEGTLQWTPGESTGTAIYKVDTSSLPPETAPAFLLESQLEVRKKVPTAEYFRLAQLFKSPTLGVLSTGKVKWRREEPVSAHPKFLLDISSTQPRLLARVNDAGGFESSQKLVAAPPIERTPQAQRYAYLPKGAKTASPVFVANWDLDGNSVEVVARGPIEDPATTEYEVATVPKNDLVWIESPEDFARLATPKEKRPNWSQSKLVSLPREGEKPVLDATLEGIQSIRRAVAAPTLRRRTAKEACQDGWRSIKQAFGTRFKN